MGASEVARIREQIDQEIAASRLALTGYAAVARHDIITHHFDNLGARFEELQAQVGKQTALEMIVQALEKHS